MRLFYLLDRLCNLYLFDSSLLATFVQKKICKNKYHLTLTMMGSLDIDNDDNLDNKFLNKYQKNRKKKYEYVYIFID
jgi:hypothetical protein